MAVTESLEGSAGTLWFHYDIRNDVLYVRLLSRRDDESHGQETDEGVILLRSLTDETVVGMTVVNWWKRFGSGTLPDSMKALSARIEPWAQKLAAAA